VFTGIVEEVARVTEVEAREGVTRLTVECALAHEHTQIGDSIAINGVCLTVVAMEGRALSFQAVPETLRRTNLGALAVGSPVDVERAVTQGRPLGGHYVQGHIDATATVRRARPDGEALELWLDAPPELLRFIVEKGVVTIDGASLTVVGVDASGFSVTLVPHTRANVVFGDPPPGYRANLEVDVMAKYIEKMLAPRLAQIEARLVSLERRSPHD
jgi:riboflavin synthase